MALKARKKIEKESGLTQRIQKGLPSLSGAPDLGENNPESIYFNPSISKPKEEKRRIRREVTDLVLSQLLSKENNESAFQYEVRTDILLQNIPEAYRPYIIEVLGTRLALMNNYRGRAMWAQLSFEEQKKIGLAEDLLQCLSERWPDARLRGLKNVVRSYRYNLGALGFMNEEERKMLVQAIDQKKKK